PSASDRIPLHDALPIYTRIQVEHPITEQICGIDIVKQQIRIADHQRLQLRQEDIQPKGYALECRINAEDIHREFAPSPGKVTFLDRKSTRLNSSHVSIS